MAHNLQQTMWQSGAENMKDRFGWAGRMVKAMYLPGSTSPLMSLNGEKKWLRSENHEQLVMTSDGAGDYSGLNTPERYDAMLRHFNQKYSNLFADNYSDVMANRYYENDKLKAVLDGIGDLPRLSGNTTWQVVTYHGENDPRPGRAGASTSDLFCWLGWI